MRHFGITIQNIENIGRKQTWNVSCRHKIYKKKNRRYFHTQNSSTCVECVCNASQTVHRINKKIERNNIIVNKRTKIKKKQTKNYVCMPCKVDKVLHLRLSSAVYRQSHPRPSARLQAFMRIFPPTNKAYMRPTQTHSLIRRRRVITVQMGE